MITFANQDWLYLLYMCWQKEQIDAKLWNIRCIHICHEVYDVYICHEVYGVLFTVIFVSGRAGRVYFFILGRWSAVLYDTILTSFWASNFYINVHTVNSSWPFFPKTRNIFLMLYIVIGRHIILGHISPRYTYRETVIYWFYREN